MFKRVVLKTQFTETVVFSLIPIPPSFNSSLIFHLETILSVLHLILLGLSVKCSILSPSQAVGKRSELGSSAFLFLECHPEWSDTKTRGTQDKMPISSCYLHPYHPRPVVTLCRAGSSFPMHLLFTLISF